MKRCRLKLEVAGSEVQEPVMAAADLLLQRLAGVQAPVKAGEMGVLAGAAAGTPRSKIVWLTAVLFSSRPGAVVAVEE